MARKKSKRIYTYKCSITEEVFKTTKEADHPEELVSVKAYYELNPDEDDRPEHIKKKLAAEEEMFASLTDFSAPETEQ